MEPLCNPLAGGKNIGKNIEEEFKKKSYETCMPKLIKMTPFLTSSSVDEKQNKSVSVNFIKTESGKMHCVKCQKVVEKIDNHIKCGAGLDLTNAELDTLAGNSIAESSLCEMNSRETDIWKAEPALVCTKNYDSIIRQNSDFEQDSNLKNELLPEDNGSEQILECGSCKLLFQDRCSFLDHKYQCHSFSSDTIDGDSCTHIKAEHYASPVSDNMEIVDNNSQFPFVENKVYSEDESCNHFSDLGNVSKEKDCSPTFTCSCHYCKCSFDSYSKLQIHRQYCISPRTGSNVKQRSERRVSCTICKEKFTSKHEYSQHLVSIHIQQTPANVRKRKYTSIEDKETFNRNTSKQETKRMVRYKCNYGVCREKFDTAAEFKAHFVDHVQNNNSGRAKVQIAKPVFVDSNQKVNNHHKNINDDNSNEIVCNGKCHSNKNLKTFHTNAYTVKNSKRKSPEREQELGFKKEESENVEFPLTNNFKPYRLGMLNAAEKGGSHKETGEMGKLHRCQSDGCGKLFKSNVLLKQHIKSIHVQPGVHKPSTEKETVHQCQNEGCGLMFDSRELLKQHIKNSHMAAFVIDSNHEDIFHYVCSFCLLLFQRKDSIEKHLTTEHDINESEFDNSYIVDRLSCCKICNSYVQSDRIMEHYKRCRRHEFMVTTLNKISDSDTGNSKAERPEHTSQGEESMGDSRGTEFSDKKKCRNKVAFCTSTISEYDIESMYTLEGESLRCNMCHSLFIRQTSLVKHLFEIHHMAKYSCSFESCSATFLSISNLEAHIKEHINKSNSIQFKCDVEGCGLKLKTLIGLMNHRQQHMKKCELCSFRYFETKELITHMSEKHRESACIDHSRDSKKCVLCSFQYLEVKSYKSHLLKCHDRPDSEAEMVYKELSQVRHPRAPVCLPNGYACAVECCLDEFQHISELVEHENKVHSSLCLSQISSTEGEVEKTPGETCGNVASPENTCTIMVKDEPNTCSISYQIDNAVQEENSMLLEKTETKRETDFFCSQCNSIFSDRIKFKEHRVLLHKYKCKSENCAAAFVTRGELKQHVISHTSAAEIVHGIAYSTAKNQAASNGKKAIGKRVKNNLDLDYNLLPYKCPESGCSKAFLYKRDLTKHSQSREHMLFCPEIGCESFFFFPGSLDEHMKEVHKKNKEKTSATDRQKVFGTDSGFKIDLVYD